jgi:hypothetical protein
VKMLIKKPKADTAGENRPKLHNRNQDAESQKTGKTSPAMFRRDDWMEFRDPNRISNKAGVAYEQLPKVVVKELCDDALDAADHVEFGLLEVNSDAVRFFVADEGPGLDGADEEIAELYSIRRALTSSKMVRLPTRGMLGNGLRVVAGVVLVARGQIRVSTRGRTLTLQPKAEDGHTAIIAVEPWHGVGTRVEITLRGPLARHARSEDGGGLFVWAQEARSLARGTPYKGKSSSHWYDPAGFWELCQAASDVRVGAFLENNLDGSTDKATEIAGDLAGRSCGSLSPEDAKGLLERARSVTRPVTPERLGKVGRRDDYFGYAHETGEFEAHGAKVPFVVEAWANRAHRPGGTICVNRTPVCAKVSVCREDGTDYAIFGCQLHHRFAVGRKGSEFQVLVNVITPYTPLTSSGKDPDLLPMLNQIREALEKAIRVAKRTAPKTAEGKRSQKATIRSRIKEAAAKLSGAGKYLFSLRQLFYEIRPDLIRALGREPMYGTFSKIVGEYEDEHGDIEHLYRDDRGTLYHPHTGETFPLGTRSVADYERPAFAFRSLLFCEKEGLFPMLKHAKWPEQFDCALCSSKGFATRAARNLIRLLKDSPELIVIFVIHDADGPGTVIYEALRQALEPHGIEVINLGLDPAEARDMGLSVEPVSPKKKRVPVAEYVPLSDRKWLQHYRVELNAMTTPQFLEWLKAKVAAYFRSKGISPKVIPPAEVIAERLEQEARTEIERRIIDEVMKAANIPERVAAEFAKDKQRLTGASQDLLRGLPNRLKKRPADHWTDVVKAKAASIVSAGEKRSKMQSRNLDAESQNGADFPPP